MDGKGMEHFEQPLAATPARGCTLPPDLTWSSPASAISLLPCADVRVPLIQLCLQEKSPSGFAWYFKPNRGQSSLSGHFSHCSRAAEQAEPVTPHLWLLLPMGWEAFGLLPQQNLSGSEHIAIIPLGAFGEWKQGLGSPGELQCR